VRSIVPLPPLRDPLVAFLRDRVAGRFYTFSSWDGRTPQRVG
jgi:hypothetical protein